MHPLFVKLGFHPFFVFFSLLKSVVRPGSCNLTLVGEQGQCSGETLHPPPAPKDF